MKNLGKIILFLFLIQYTLFATIKATISDTTIEVGEMVTYSLYLSGEDIVRPNIRVLCGEDVISTSSRTSIEMSNGNISKNNILSYKFMPLKSCTIEPIEVEIDGVIQKSNSVKIDVKEVVPNKDSDFILTLKTSTKEVYVGEPFEVTLTFKQRRDSEAVDSEFTPPKLKGFWIKSESKPKRTQDEKYSLTEITYVMAPQRVGTLTITKAKMRIASRSNSRDNWGSWIPQIKWKTYFSNELDIEVKPLPAGVDLVGDFTISAVAQSTEINANEALNVTVRVEGRGNLEDIKSFKPYVNGVSVFEEKIVIDGNQLTQKIAFVAEDDFTIAPFTLKYFDPKTQEIKTIATQAIKVKVKNAKAKEPLTIKREEKITSDAVVTQVGFLSGIWVFIAFILGLALGIALMIVQPWKLMQRQKSFSIKEPKILLTKLFPYKDDVQVQNIIDILEKNIYSNANIEIDKKLLKEIVKKYNLV